MKTETDWTTETDKIPITVTETDKKSVTEISLIMITHFLTTMLSKNADEGWCKTKDSQLHKLHAMNIVGQCRLINSFKPCLIYCSVNYQLLSEF